MTDSQVTSVLLAVAMFIAGGIALMAFGPLAVNVVLTVTVAALILERTSLFRRVEEARADADDAVRDGQQLAERVRDLETEVDELRGWLVTLRDVLTGDTQPIALPAPMGPVTEPAAEVAAAQVRALMDAGAVVERPFVVAGVERAFTFRVEQEDAA